MKRILLFAGILLCAVAVKAQAPLSFGSVNGYQPGFRHFHQGADTNSTGKKWFMTKYGGISTGFIAFKGGSGTFISAPVGLQIHRRLTDNVYAFAGVSVAPSFFQFNSAFNQPVGYKNSSFMNGNHFGLYSTARVGLMYINNDRTFSISGSIGVSRSSYNGYAPYYHGIPSSAPGNANINY